jgi:hypothetical protein
MLGEMVGTIMKLLMGDPLLSGTVHCTVTAVPETVTSGGYGAYGVTGDDDVVTVLDGDDAGPGPDVLVAATVNDTFAPPATPVTSYTSPAPGVGSSAVPGAPAATSIGVWATPLTVGVMTNAVMGSPPSDPTVQRTSAPS